MATVGGPGPGPGQGPGRKRKDFTAYRGKNDSRKELISNSRYSQRVLKSQQTCSISENRHKLEKFLSDETSSLDDCGGKQRESMKNCIEGLLTVWDLLTADAIGTDGKEHTSCFLRFDDALEAFCDRFKNIEPPYLNTDKDKFQYALLNEQWGLCVYIITHEESKTRFVVLRPDEIDLELFLDTICSKSDLPQFTPRITLDNYLIERLLETLDSEWDRIVSRVLLGVDRSRRKLERFGLDSREITRNVQKVCLLLSTLSLFRPRGASTCIP